MKQLLMISAIFLTFQAQAEIFKCKNDNGKITYQGTPCVAGTGTIGKINKAPEVPIEEQARAQSKLDNSEEAIKLKQRQQEENAKKQEAWELEKRRVEALERQAEAMERQTEVAKRPEYDQEEALGTDRRRGRKSSKAVGRP